MEDFKSMPLGELINLGCNLAAPDFDLLRPSDDFYQKKLTIEYIISDRIVLKYKDTMIFLNTKRVAAEEARTFFIRENTKIREEKRKKEKHQYQYHYNKEGEECLIRMEKTMGNIVNVLQEINLNTQNIRQTNSELSVGMSTQACLAREMEQKMNSIGMFLTKITNLKQEEWKKQYGAWEDEYD